MYLIEQKFCNLIPQIGKKQKCKHVNKSGRWKVQNRTVVILYRKKMKEKSFSKKLRVAGIKCHNKTKKSRWKKRSQDFNFLSANLCNKQGCLQPFIKGGLSGPMS